MVDPLPLDDLQARLDAVKRTFDRCSGEDDPTLIEIEKSLSAIRNQVDIHKALSSPSKVGCSKCRFTPTGCLKCRKN